MWKFKDNNSHNIIFRTVRCLHMSKSLHSRWLDKEEWKQLEAIIFFATNFNFFSCAIYSFSLAICCLLYHHLQRVFTLLILLTHGRQQFNIHRVMKERRQAEWWVLLFFNSIFNLILEMNWIISSHHENNVDERFKVDYHALFIFCSFFLFFISRKSLIYKIFFSFSSWSSQIVVFIAHTRDRRQLVLSHFFVLLICQHTKRLRKTSRREFSLF